ncbi:N-acetylmuramoyl-L-alanine amidase [Thiohalospira sp.]|uniref:N-acetylmuramoyl-L-alanine amidase n=1 Tax=Thiohalospira sp. TaxID=3080549 RepID=UPI003980C827
MLLFLVGADPAMASSVEGVRLWQAPDSLRLVFDLSDGVDHEVFELDDPDRVVVDLEGAELEEALEASTEDTWVEEIRSGRHGDGRLRVVLDMERSVSSKTFLLEPNEEYGHRLVVDLTSESAKEEEQDSLMEVVREAEENQQGENRDLIIAIDAGHGGEDPGARGPSGTHEKDVVMQIARRLEKRVEAAEGMTPLMIRDGDYFVALRDRLRKAREAKADLFVSIHADAFENSRAHGSSVYALSQNGATSEAAKRLAKSENEADLIGGVRLDDKDETLASVLMDLSQTGAIEASLNVGQEVLENMGGVNELHKSDVEQAAFMVLKSPDIPSILVETAFLSNPSEEQRLRSSAHQKKLAASMMSGIRSYFRDNAPPGTVWAEKDFGTAEHVVSNGETLSSIAQDYRVSPGRLRSANGLDDDMLRAGTTLDIPGGS